MIAPWLKNHLIATGNWNADGVGRAARVSRHTCPAWVVAGLDNARCAAPAIADVEPLSVIGEVLAVAAGRTTYNLIRTGTRIELDRRSPLHIAGSPPGTRDYDVVAEHVCGADPLPSLLTVYQPRATSTTTDGPPPF